MLKTGLKTVFAVCLIIWLVGCSVNKKEIDDCVRLCESNGGIDYLKPQPGFLFCSCANGVGKTL